MHFMANQKATAPRLGHADLHSFRPHFLSLAPTAVLLVHRRDAGWRPPSFDKGEVEAVGSAVSSVAVSTNSVITLVQSQMLLLFSFMFSCRFLLCLPAFSSAEGVP